MPGRTAVHVKPGLFILFAIGVLILPLPWLGALVLSSAVHELCHAAAVRYFGVSVRSLRIDLSGVHMETEALNPFQELICSLAGPVGALALIPFAQWLPRSALCALVQSAYHLLPLYPLDGGRAVRSLSAWLGWPPVFPVLLEGGVLLYLSAMGFFCFISGTGLLPTVLISAAVFRVCREKFLANRRGTGYNKDNYLR